MQQEWPALHTKPFVSSLFRDFDPYLHIYPQCKYPFIPPYPQVVLLDWDVETWRAVEYSKVTVLFKKEVSVFVTVCYSLSRWEHCNHKETDNTRVGCGNYKSIENMRECDWLACQLFSIHQQHLRLPKKKKCLGYLAANMEQKEERLA